MILLIRMLNSPIDPQLVDYVRASIAFALDRFEDRVRDVRVVIEDVNGPRGGIDKEVRIVLTGHGELTQLVVSAVDSKVEAAVATAVDRVQRCLSRTLDRERTSSTMRVRGRARFSKAG